MGFSNQQLQQTTFYSYTKQDNQQQYLSRFCAWDSITNVLLRSIVVSCIFFFLYSLKTLFFGLFFIKYYYNILWIPQWHYLQQTMEYKYRVALDCYRLFSQTTSNTNTNFPSTIVTLLKVISNSIAHEKKRHKTKVNTELHLYFYWNHKTITVIFYLIINFYFHHKIFT